MRMFTTAITDRDAWILAVGAAAATLPGPLVNA